MEVHIGQRIETVLKSKGMTVTAFADQIGYSRRNVYVIFKRSHIDTELLERIGKVLDHDFFQYFFTNKTAEPQAFQEEGGPLEYYRKKNKEYKQQLDKLTREVAYLTEINELLREKVKELEGK